MKYSEKNKPIACMLTQNPCYKGTRKMDVKGVLWHSTGANNPAIKRYVQPSDNADNKAEMLQLLGKNQYNNDWNHTTRRVGVNAFIGKLADGTITTVQTMPWDYRPWGCGAGAKGSCNSGWIQFEIGEDSLTNKDYFNKVYEEACELTAYLCDMYNLDPHGTATVNGVKVPVILCHYDSYKLGLGSNHGDVLHWFKKYGKTMEDVRNDVAALMKKPTAQKPAEPKPEATPAPDFKLGDTVKLVEGATYASGKSIPSWVFKKTLYIRALRGDSATISTQQTGAVTGTVKYKDLVKLGASNNQVATGAPVEVEPYQVKINSNALNIRKGPGKNYDSVGMIKDRGTYIIVAESDGQGASKWLKLASNAGWISADFAEKVETSAFTAYKVQVNSNALNIRRGPGKNYASVGMIRDRGIYTIIEESDGQGASKWLKLKSGAGWISADFTKKL